jgi:hypothetical protein
LVCAARRRWCRMAPSGWARGCVVGYEPALHTLRDARYALPGWWGSMWRGRMRQRRHVWRAGWRGRGWSSTHGISRPMVPRRAWWRRPIWR